MVGAGVTTDGTISGWVTERNGGTFTVAVDDGAIVAGGNAVSAKSSDAIGVGGGEATTGVD